MRRFLAFAVVCMFTTASVAWGASSEHQLPIKRRASRQRSTSSHRATRQRKHRAATETVALTSAHAVADSTATAVLFGEQNIEPTVDNNSPGMAEAFPFAGKLSGTTQAVAVYVDSRNRATQLVAGVYSDANGQPGSRLASGTLTSPTSGAWNTVPITSAALTAGHKYWLAILGRGGYAYFRDEAGGPCESVNSAQSSLWNLPGNFNSGLQWNTCPVSAYVTGSTPTAVAAGGPTTLPTPAVNTVAPQVSGTPTQGQTLSTSDGTWTGSPTSYTYQWQACNTSGLLCSDIPGATASSLTLTANQVGDTVRTVVTAVNAGGSVPANSNQTATVAATPPPPPAAPSNTALPQISGTTTQGQTLTTTNGSWNGSPTSYSYQWRDCNSSGTCTNISGATSNTYTLTANDVGNTIRVIVTATNSGGSTPATSNPTATIASSGGSGGGSGTQTNCLGTDGSGQVSYSSLDSCGYPSPDTTGVPAGTSLTSVGSISCSNQTINAVSTSGPVSIGSNCTITNSRLTGGQITIQGGITGVTLSHDEISGPYTGSPTSPTCSYSSTNGTTSDILAEGAATAVTLNYDYLHCAAEPLNGNFQVSNSYVIADECWGPCGSGSTTHNEALYIAGGGSGGTKVEHNTLLNQFAQTAGIFGDDHAYGPIHNLTIDNNLVSAGGDNGAIATGDTGDGNTGVSITNNRLSYVYSTSMPTGGDTASSWSGNYRDDNLQPVSVSS